MTLDLINGEILVFPTVSFARQSVLTDTSVPSGTLVCVTPGGTGRLYAVAPDRSLALVQGLVSSVNGKTGHVLIDAYDLDYDASTVGDFLDECRRYIPLRILSDEVLLEVPEGTVLPNVTFSWDYAGEPLEQEMDGGIGPLPVEQRSYTMTGPVASDADLTLTARDKWTETKQTFSVRFV
jgi:hypothetical protein